MWTNERVEQLKQLWGGGMTAAQIGERIGGVSRNAVIGKAHRLGRSGSKAPRPRPVRPSQAKPVTVAAAPPPPPPSPPPTLAKRQPDVRAEDLPWHRRCQWPIGHPGEREFHFCGAVAAEGKPYCAEHCTLAYRQKEAAA